MVGVGVGVTVTVGVGVGEAPDVGVGVGDTVGLGVGVGVGLKTGVGVGVGGAVTVNVKSVVLEMPPPVAFTVIPKLPTGVLSVVIKASVLEQVGVQDVDANDAVVPAGIPDAVKETL